MRASKTANATALPQLLALLQSNESIRNQRHAVRALGNIGGSECEAMLLLMLDSQSGIILGDVAHSLARIGSKRAIRQLERLAEHEILWVRQNVQYALKRFKQNMPGGGRQRD